MGGDKERGGDVRGINRRGTRVSTSEGNLNIIKK